MKTNVTANLNKLAKLAGVIALNLIVSSGAFAAVTVINFDNLVLGTSLNSQYSGQGVQFVNGYVMTSSAELPSYSGTNLAFSDIGNINVHFTVGNVSKVSAFVSGSATTMTAYDSNGVAISQSITGEGNNQLLSVVTNGAPIAAVSINSIEILGLDELIFETVAAIPICESINQNLYNSFKAMPDSQYKVLKTAAKLRTSILASISKFDQSLKTDVSNKTLLSQLATIRRDVDSALKPSAEKTNLLKMIDDLIAKTKASLC